MTEIEMQELARVSFEFYVRYMNEHWVVPDFHVEMMRALEADEGCLVSMPPDHAKSTISTVLYTTWELGKNPRQNIIIAVGSPKLKSAFAIQIRRIMESERYKKVFRVNIRKDSDGKLMFHMVEGGQMVIVSKGEAISGIRANIIVFDDLVGGAKESRSSVNREAAWRYLTMDLLTREDKTHRVKVVGVGTRWHKEDVLCRMEKQEGFEDLIVIKFKAINEEGKALWPERHSIEDLLIKKKTMGTKDFLALYQQDPADEAGTIFKREWLTKTYKELPHKFDRMIQSWDATFSKSEDSDYVVGTCWGKLGAQIYLVDAIRKRMNYPETKMAVKSFAAKWPRALKKIIEKKANGAALIDDLAKDVTGMVAYNPTESKVARANTVSPLFEAGNVLLPDPSIAPWIHDYIEELTSFPNALHDDYVDSTSQALIDLKSSADWLANLNKR